MSVELEVKLVFSIASLKKISSDVTYLDNGELFGVRFNGGRIGNNAWPRSRYFQVKRFVFEICSVCLDL